MQENFKLISKVGTYLIYDKIDTLTSEIPDIPDFSDPQMGEIWAYANSKLITRIQNQTNSIQKITEHGIEAYDWFSEAEANKNDYNSYLTNRLHSFAEDWLFEESKHDEKFFKSLYLFWSTTRNFRHVIS